MKKFLLTSLLAGLLCVGVVANTSKSAIAYDEEDVPYFADFEGKVVNDQVPPDRVTDFIWAQQYLECRTVQHNGSNMLYMTAADGTDQNGYFTAFGGFGTASKSNLAKLRQGEPYEVSLYMEFANCDFVEVEAVCGGTKWGAIRVFSNGNILADPGGDNLVDASYKNHILKFKFTYSFNADYEGGVNGFITFKANHALNAYCYFDDCKIAKTPYMMEGTFEEYPVGEFDGSNDFGYRTIVYTQTADMTSTSEIVEESNNKFLRISYDCDKVTSQEVFFLNKLKFLNMNREYIFSFNLNTQHVSSLSLRYGGRWFSDQQQVNIDISGNSISKIGDKILEVSYASNLVTIRFIVSPLDGTTAESYQFGFYAIADNGEKAIIDIDNTRFVQIPVLASISLNTANVVNKFAFGDTFSHQGLTVIGHNSDGTTFSINADDCEYSGYSMSTEGNQIVTVTYQGFTAIYQISVYRVLNNMIINIDNVKRNYGYGEPLDLTGLQVYVTYDDEFEGSTLTHNALRLYGYAVFAGGFDSHKQGTYVIEILYHHLRKSFEVYVSFDEAYSFNGISYEGVGA